MTPDCMVKKETSIAKGVEWGGMDESYLVETAKQFSANYYRVAVIAVGIVIEVRGSNSAGVLANDQTAKLARKPNSFDSVVIPSAFGFGTALHNGLYPQKGKSKLRPSCRHPSPLGQSSAGERLWEK